MKKLAEVLSLLALGALTMGANPPPGPTQGPIAPSGGFAVAVVARVTGVRVAPHTPGSALATPYHTGPLEFVVDVHNTSAMLLKNIQIKVTPPNGPTVVVTRDLPGNAFTQALVVVPNPIGNNVCITRKFDVVLGGTGADPHHRAFNLMAQCNFKSSVEDPTMSMVPDRRQQMRQGKIFLANTKLRLPISCTQTFGAAYSLDTDIYNKSNTAAHGLRIVVPGMGINSGPYAIEPGNATHPLIANVGEDCKIGDFPMTLEDSTNSLGTKVLNSGIVLHTSRDCVFTTPLIP